MRVRNEAIKLAIFTAVGLLAAALLYLTLGRITLEPTSTYYLRTDNASGLTTGDPVRIAGVRVGRVNAVSVGAHDMVTVKFSLQKSLHLTDQTKALVRYQNLLGDRFLELQQPNNGGHVEKAGYTLPPSRTIPALDLDVLLNGFKPLFAGLQPTQINQLATNVIKTLQGQGGTLQDLLTQTASLTNSVADHDQEIGGLITNLDSVLGQVDQRDHELRSTITDFASLLGKLDADKTPILNAVDQIDSMSTSVAGLLTTVRPPLAGTIRDTNSLATMLDQNTDSLQTLLTDVPKAYQAQTNTGSHGSFFNFYLCSVRVETSGANGKPIYSPIFGSNSSTERCKK